MTLRASIFLFKITEELTIKNHFPNGIIISCIECTMAYQPFKLQGGETFVTVMRMNSSGLHPTSVFAAAALENGDKRRRGNWDNLWKN